MTPNIEGNAPPARDTPGPLWATMMNSTLTAIDAHNHTPGSGVPIAAPNITFINDFIVPGALTSVGSLGFSGTVPTGPCRIYSNGLDLYATDNFSRVIQITSGDSLNFRMVRGGGFTGDYVPSGAQVVYALGTYTFRNPSAALANVIAGDLVSFTNITLAPVATISTFTVVSNTASNTFTPAASSTNYVVGAGVAGAAVDLCPYLQVSSSTTTLSFTNLVYATLPAPFSWPFYAGFAVSVQANKAGYRDYSFIEQYPSRNMSGFQKYAAIPTASGAAGTIGGLQNRPVLLTFIPGSPTYQITYSDLNLVLQSEIAGQPYRSVWGIGLTLSWRLFSVNSSGTPINGFGGP